MRKRPTGSAAALDRFGDQSSALAGVPASQQTDKTAQQHVSMSAPKAMKLVSTRLPVELVELLQRIAAHTELSIQDVITEGVRRETRRVISRYEEQVGHTLPPLPQKVRV